MPPPVNDIVGSQHQRDQPAPPAGDAAATPRTQPRRPRALARRLARDGHRAADRVRARRDRRAAGRGLRRTTPQGPPAAAGLARPGRRLRRRAWSSAIATCAPRSATSAAGSWPIAGRRSRSTADPVTMLDAAQRLTAEAVAASGVGGERLIGVGVGFAAPVDAITGRVLTGGIMPGWDGVDPAEELEKRLGMPVQVENDANAGAIGEHMFGAGRGVADMIYLQLSAGIGLGLIMAGRPYRGAGGRRGRDRARARRRQRADLPLRQPRLPRDGGQPGRRRGTARAQPRRAAHDGAGDGARARRRPRRRAGGRPTPARRSGARSRPP